MKIGILARCEAILEPSLENVARANILNQYTRDVAVISVLHPELMTTASPTIDPEYTEGQTHADNGGKLKANPYEGGSAQWWAWNNGYKERKAKIEADKRRKVV